MRIWQIATISRAIENGCYLAAAAQAGGNGTTQFAGHSRIVDPAGEVLADAGDRAEMLSAELRPRLVDEVRAGRADSHACLGRPATRPLRRADRAAPAARRPRRAAPPSRRRLRRRPAASRLARPAASIR